ncbi:MAG: ATP-binding protein [Steroidobacteraceae bacterium]
MRGLPLKTLRGRLVAAALVWVLIGTLIGGWALAQSFRAAVARTFDARLQSTLLTLIANAELDANGNPTLQRPLQEPEYERVYSGWYWLVLDAQHVRLRSRSLWDMNLVAPTPPQDGGAVFRAAVDSAGRKLRLAAQTVRLPSSARPLTFIVTADAAAITAETRRFNVLLVLALSTLGAGLLVAVVLQTSVGLRPLQRVVADIESVRTGAIDALNSTGTRELDTLVAQINTLISHNRRILERARTSAADLAHALKTPLAILRADVESGHVESGQRQIAAMERIVGRYLTRAATAGPGREVRTAVAPIIAAIVKGMQRVHTARNLHVSIELQDGVLAPLDTEDFEELAGNLIENAFKWARSRLVIRAHRDAQGFCFEVEDDGPGLDADSARRAVDRGQRFDTQVEGSGIGLSIVADMMEIYGGTIDLVRGAMGGLRVTVFVQVTAAAGNLA